MRLFGWQRRLRELVEGAEARPYALGEWDCFRMACAVVEALTGVDHWPQWAGKYRTRREVMRLLHKHGSNFVTAGDWFFAGAHTSATWARRGDICCVEAPEVVGGPLEKHLGVCLGAETAFLGPQGLVRVATLSCLCSWRIG